MAGDAYNRPSEHFADEMMIFQNGWFPVGVVMAAWPVLLVILLCVQSRRRVSVSQHRSTFLVAAVMLPLAWV